MFQCPQCKHDQLRIHHLVWHATDVDLEEQVWDSEAKDLEWDDVDRAECLDCHWTGIVRSMSIDDTEEAEAQQEEDYANDPRR